MAIQTPRTLAQFLLLVAVLLATISACKEKDVPFIIDEEEIERAALESDEGRDLFRTNNIILSDPYMLADGSVCKDSIVSHKRELSVVAPDTLIDYGSLGYIREALFRATDTFLVHTTRVKGTDTATYQAKRVFVRHAAFLKLGDDSRPFVGWVLFGFNGYGGSGSRPTYVTLYSQNSAPNFLGEGAYPTSLVDIVGPPYMRLDRVPEFDKGTRLPIKVSVSATPILTLETDSGFFNRTPIRESEGNFVDTIQTPNDNDALYNLIVVQPLVDSTGLPGRNGILVPYRLR